MTFTAISVRAQNWLVMFTFQHGTPKAAQLPYVFFPFPFLHSLYLCKQEGIQDSFLITYTRKYVWLTRLEQKRGSEIVHGEGAYLLNTEHHWLNYSTSIVLLWFLKQNYPFLQIFYTKKVEWIHILTCICITTCIWHLMHSFLCKDNLHSSVFLQRVRNVALFPIFVIPIFWSWLSIRSATVDGYICKDHTITVVTHRANLHNPQVPCAAIM